MPDPKDLLAPIGGSKPEGTEPGVSQTFSSPEEAMPKLRTVAGPASTGQTAPVAPPAQPASPVGSPALRPQPEPQAAAPAYDQQPITPTRPVAYEEVATGPNKRLIFGGIGAAVAVVAVAAFVLLHRGPAVVPSTYTTFTSADNTFTCETPNGWNTYATGEASGDKHSTKLNGVYMQSGDAAIEVTFSTVSGLVGSQLLFGKDPTPEAMGGSRAAGVAWMQKRAVAKQFKGYSEKLMPDCPSGMGAMIPGKDPGKDLEFVPDARLYEFTASGNWLGFGGKIHGYRATMAGSNLIAAAECHCSEAEWEKLKPAFLHVIEKVQEVSAKGDDEDDAGEGRRSPVGDYRPWPRSASRPA